MIGYCIEANTCVQNLKHIHRNLIDIAPNSRTVLQIKTDSLMIEFFINIILQ